MIRVPAPAAVHGDALTAELETAGVPDADVTLDGDELRIDAPESSRSTVEQVVAAHVPPSPTPGPDDDLAARIQAVHDDPQVSASVKKLTAALLGLNGESAVAGRPTDTDR
jgi:hypothetical protein